MHETFVKQLLGKQNFLHRHSKSELCHQLSWQSALSI